MSANEFAGQTESVDRIALAGTNCHFWATRPDAVGTTIAKLPQLGARKSELMGKRSVTYTLERLISGASPRPGDDWWPKRTFVDQIT